ncbi:MAG: methyltransferase domain-containing protein [Candidatus Sumerlaeota bacterium]|nr:methyltransferase domain-containing protein [Candidatus Sumerlaeota bacterium]
MTTTDTNAGWYDNDALWDTLKGFIFPPKLWAEVAQEIDSVIRLAALEPGATILDLCCGPGRHSLELARRGFRVTGVDITASYLEQARALAKQENLDVEFIQEDMRRFERRGAYDCVLNLFNSFGYFDDPEDDRRALLAMHRSLKSGGALVMDLFSREVAVRNHRRQDWYFENKDLFFMVRRALLRDQTWIENRWITMRDGARREYVFGHRLYGEDELATLLRECGFRDIQTYGDFTGAAFTEQSTRLILAACA